MMAGGAGNFIVRHAIAGGAAGGVISGGQVVRDPPGRPPRQQALPEQMNGSGRMPHQGMQGGTMAPRRPRQQHQPTAPPAATPPRTSPASAGRGDQRGGRRGDGLHRLLSYQVPAGAVATQTPRTLVVRGVTINGNMGAAVATTPTTLAWSLAFGHTAVSLATAEAATTKVSGGASRSASSPSRSAQRSARSTRPTASRGGSTADSRQPRRVHRVRRQADRRTATASQSIWYHVSFDAYYE